VKEQKLEERCLNKEVIYKGRIFTVNRDTVELPDGKTATRDIVLHPGAVAVVASNGGNILMVRQFRYALGRVTLEIPAGKIDPDELPEICARRELREETGFDGELSFLGAFHTSPGFTDEIIHLYFAENLFWSPLKADEDEFLNVISVSWQEAIKMASSGKIQDFKSVTGLLLAQNRFIP